MATRKKPEDSFPSPCCGACYFCYGDRGEHECWVDPPRPVDPEDVDGTKKRGVPVDPKWPPCVHFRHRQNG